MKRRSKNNMKTKPQQITSFITDFPHWLAVVFLASFAMSTAGMLFGAAGFLGDYCCWVPLGCSQLLC